MNLWANRLGQLTLFSVALFFSSCEDDTSLLGIKNPNSKFQGKYVEIPLTSGIMLLDSIRTSNYYFNLEYNRLLVGRYAPTGDAGPVISNGVTQFYHPSNERFPDDFQVTNVYVQLQLDHSTHGTSTTTNPTFTVYEVDEDLVIENRRKYISYTPVARKASPLGSVNYEINPALFREEIEMNNDSKTDNDTTRVIKIPVTDADFVNRIKNVTKNWITSNTTPPSADSTLVIYERFREEFKGLLVESTGGDVAVGVTLSGASGVIIEYSSGGKSYQRALSFISALSYNQFLGSWKGTAIDENLNAGSPILEAEPGDRYVQSGTGIVTYLDFTPFYDFIAEQGSSNLVFNSAQIIIDGAVTTEESRKFQPPPAALGLMAIDADYERWKAIPGNEGRDWSLFQQVFARDYTYYEPSVLRFVGSVIADNNYTLFGASDLGSPASLGFSSADNRYSGFITLLLQRMYLHRNETKRFNNFALYPVNSSFPGLGGKALNTVTFPSDKITLKIFYTEPTITND